MSQVLTGNEYYLISDDDWNEINCDFKRLGMYLVKRVTTNCNPIIIDYEIMRRVFFEVDGINYTIRVWNIMEDTKAVEVSVTQDK
jgi:hypothetical protein